MCISVNPLTNHEPLGLKFINSVLSRLEMWLDPRYSSLLSSLSPSDSLLAPGDGGEGEFNDVSASRKFQVEEIEMRCITPQSNVKPSRVITPFFAGASTWIPGFWLEEKRL